MKNFHLCNIKCKILICLFCVTIALKIFIEKKKLGCRRQNVKKDILHNITKNCRIHYTRSRSVFGRYISQAISRYWVTTGRSPRSLMLLWISCIHVYSFVLFYFKAIKLLNKIQERQSMRLTWIMKHFPTWKKNVDLN